MTIAHASAQMSPELASDKQVIDRLSAAIDVHSPRSILEFGSAVAEATSRYTDDLLSKARASDLDETGKTLTDIVMTAQDFDMSSLDNSMTRLPLIGGALKFLTRGKQRAVARFDSVKTQIDKLVSSVEATAARMERQDRDYSAIYKGIREEHAQLSLHVQAIDQRLVEAERERDSLRSSSNMADIEQAAVMEAACQYLAKRKDDLLVLQHAALQSLPMVRILQSNNLALIDKFTTIRTLTLPTWKRTFLLALSLDEQKQAVGLANAIDDATNSMMKRNAELLKQNSVAVAKANQRLVIDVDTLKSVHDNVIQTLDEVRAIHLDGKATRSKAISELGRLRSEMSATVRSLSSQTSVIDG